VKLPVPVISVGNITCGGTGKTPVVEMLVRALLARGLRPAILSRGYRAGPDGKNDEARLLAANLPQVPHFIGGDRIVTGRAAIAAGAEALVLDDGFQHVRLARDLDLVLIDALDPFGGGRPLPAGLLREPLSALSGAGLLAITRGALAPPRALGILRGLLRDRFPRIPRIEIDLEPLGWEPLAGGGELRGPEALAGKKVAAFAGIGNPEAFRRQLVLLGVGVAAWVPFRDHHAYSTRDLEEIGRRARACGADAVATTQKDAVKIGGRPLPGPERWLFLRIAARTTAGAEALEQALDRALGRFRGAGAPRGTA
jgi:tetraacyldisaccharide 4'-kinase